jgi:hypothetical protein
VDHNIWVDAFTSWGICLLVDGRWATWRLVEGQRTVGWDIGRVKTISVELAALWITDASICDMQVRIFSDNTDVIGALL